MIGVLPRFGSRRIRRIASWPSSRGIRKSIKTRSGFQLSNASRASTPSLVVRVINPIGSSIFCNNSRFSSRSSAMRMRISFCPGRKCNTRRRSVLSLAAIDVPSSTSTSKQKVVPWPSSLLTCMSPPISRVNSRLIVRPRPVPVPARWPVSVCSN